LPGNRRHHFSGKEFDAPAVRTKQQIDERESVDEVIAARQDAGLAAASRRAKRCIPDEIRVIGK